MDETQDASAQTLSPQKKRQELTAAERRERGRQYERNYRARLKAKELGQEGPPLLRKPYGPGEDHNSRRRENANVNPEAARARVRERNRRARKKWSAERRAIEAEYVRRWRMNLTAEHRAEMNRKKAVRRTTEREKLHVRMSTAVYCALKRFAKSGKAGSTWVTLVGYTVDDLAVRLKRTLPDGHTWADFMAGKLHIEHIVPVSAFNFRSAECHDFKRCWALSNLRLLPVLENLKKGTKLLAPFQPSLL